LHALPYEESHIIK